MFVSSAAAAVSSFQVVSCHANISKHVVAQPNICAMNRTQCAAAQNASKNTCALYSHEMITCYNHKLNKPVP